MNVADRIYQYAVAVGSLSAKQDKTAMSYWPALLANKTDTVPLGETEVASRLIALCEEVDLLMHMLKSSNVPADCYVSDCKHLKLGFSPARITTAWAHVVPNFSPTVLRSLQWSSHVLGATEESIEDVEIETINKLASELEAILGRPDFPRGLRVELLRHISLIQRALADYPIHGAQRLKRSIATIVGDVTMDQTVLAEAAASQDPTTRSAIGKFKETLTAVANAVQKTDKTITAGKSIISAVQPILQIGVDMFR